MNIARLSWKNANANRSRFFLTAAAVVLSVAFLTATLILADSITGTAESDIAEANESVSFVVEGETVLVGDGGPGEPAQNVTETLPTSVLDSVGAAPGVDSAEPVVSGFAKLVADGAAVGDSSALDVGRNWIVDSELNPFTLERGDPPEPGEVVLDLGLASDGGIGVGDTVTVLTATGVHDVRVSGLARYGPADAAPLQRTILFEESQAFAFMDEVGYSEIRVSVTDSVATLEAFDERLPDVVVLDSAAYITAQQSAASSPFTFLSFFLIAFAAIATVAGTTIIFNTFAIAISQRRRELALMRAVGATRREVLGSVLGESVLIAVLATGTGLVVGLAAASGLRATMGAVGLSFIDGPLVIAPVSLLIAAFVGLAVTIGSAWGPARAAAGAAPIEALRQSAVEARATSRLRMVLGVVAMLVGIGGLIGAAASESTPMLLIAVLIVPGLILAGPSVISGTAIGARPALSQIAGIEGEIATTNLRRNPRRAASTSLGLTLGVAMVGFFTVLASSLTANLSTSLDDNLQADIVVASVNNDVATVDTELGERLGLLDGVAEVSSLTVSEGSSNDIEAVVGAVEPDIQNLYDFDVTAGSLEAIFDGGIAVWANGPNPAPALGETTEVSLGGGVLRVPVVAVFENSLGGFDPPTHLVSEATLESVQSDMLATSIFVGTDGSSSAAQAVQDAVADTPGALYETRSSFISSASSGVDSILNLVYAMLGMTVFIAIVGVANTTALAVSERTREIGMMRAIGTTRRGVRRVIRLEAALLSTTGAIVGLLIAVSASWAFVRSQGGTQLTVVSFPLLSLAVIGVGAALAGVAAAALPAWRASRLGPLEAIASA